MGAFFNSGQICIAVKRLYVHEKVYEPVVAALAKLADDAVIGNGLDAGVQFGPLQNKMQFERVKGLLEDGRRHGKIRVVVQSGSGCGGCHAHGTRHGLDQQAP